MNYVIYCHTNKSNGKRYIGQTSIGMDKRWYHHWKQAFNPKSPSYKSIFSQAIRKYGKDNFDHEILERDIIAVGAANEAEQWWIAHFCSDDTRFGYNGTEGGLNYRKSEEHKQKLREARLKQLDPRLGKKHSSEAKAKMSVAKVGKKRGSLSPEHRRKIGLANTNVSFSEERRRKIGEANRKRIVSEETRRKMREAHARRKQKEQNGQSF